MILDSGSLHALVDRSCVDKLGSRIKKQRLPKIELENGQRKKVYEIEGEVQAEVEGISVAIVVRCVNARGSYDILLGQDWLRKTRCHADCSSDILYLGGSVRFRQ